MKNVDADLRFMALNDLMAECAKTQDALDSTTEAQVVEQVLVMFNDSNSEVKNQAVKAIGALVKKVSEARQMFIIETLITYSAATKEDQLRDLANLGLRTVIREIPPGTPLSRGAAVERLVPQLVEQLSPRASTSSTPDMLLNAAELLHDLFARFGSDIRPKEDLQAQALQTLVLHIGSKRPAVQKRVVDALAQLVAVAPSDSEALLQTLVSSVIHPTLSASNKSTIDIVAVVSLIGAISMRAPEKLGRAVSRDSELLTKLLAAGQTQSGGGAAADTAMDEDDDDDDTAQLADLREAVLSALERLLLKCPKEMSPFVNATLALAGPLITWDPNFAGGNDEDGDDEMGEDDDADDDAEDDFDEEYSDDEDSSWKVRRAAARVFRAAFETRPEMLSYFVNTSAPLLLSRFSEREQSVKLEVWSTYARLLDIVKLLGLPNTNKIAQSPGSPLPPRGAREDTPTSLKRKRGAQDTAMSQPSPPEEASLVSAISSQSPTVCKAVLKQISPKSIAISQAGFAVLDALVSVLNGGLEDQLAAFAPAIEMALPSTASASAESLSGSVATSLKIMVLSFVAKLLAAHPPAAFGPSLNSQVIPCLVACTADKFNKIASSAFNAISALVKSLKANNENQPSLSDMIQVVYEATATRLEAPTTDSEVRESAVVTLGDILSAVGDQLNKVKLDKPLGLLSASLRREVTRTVAVRTTTKVASSPLLQGQAEIAAWTSDSILEIASFLRSNNRILKVDSFACLPVLIDAGGQNLPSNVVESTLSSVLAFISAEDLLLLPPAINVVAAFLRAQPQATLGANSFEACLPRVYALVDSPLLQSGVALDSLLDFFATLVKAGVPPASIVSRLRERNSRAAPRCIGAVVRQAPEVASSVSSTLIATASASKTSDASVAFALHALGEIGRIPGYQDATKAFEVALDKMLQSSSEEVRSSAAFALGNLAAGSEELVDQVISHISSGSAQEAVLALSALKEFIAHAQPAAIGARADSLWQPLLNICAIDGPPPPEPGLPADAKPDQKKQRDQRIEAEFKKNEPIRAKWQQTETSRAVAAECLGKIILTDPSRFLPMLQSRNTDALAGIRCAVITAIRFTLVDPSQEYDNLLQAVIVSFLSLMRDVNLDVRRIALSTFNSAASHKTHLVRDSLPTLLPLLYEQTKVNNDLVRIVEMGPFKHRVDDGLEPRKAAYEACYTLLDTCLGRFDSLEMLEVVLRGLTDDNEIKAICYLMLSRLAQVAPAATTLRLDAAAPAFSAILNEKLKDTAVKQEQERHLQIQKSALRAFVALSKLATPTSTPGFSAALEQVKGRQSRWQREYEELVKDSSRFGGASQMEVD